MPEIKSLSEVYLILGFFVPGAVITFIRSQLLTGRMAPHKDALLSYFIISIIYYAIILPLLQWILLINEVYLRTLSWLAIIVLVPATIGLLLGLDTSHGWSRRIFERLRISTVHAIPTAWDYKFGKGESQWLLVTLKDGTRYAGYYSSDSFSSTDQTERDLYIEGVYDLDSCDRWSPANGKSLLVASGEISRIEFWPDRKD